MVSSAVLASSNAVPEGYDGPRACRPLELAPTLDLINYVFRHLRTPPGRPTMGWDYPHVYNPANLDNVRIVARNGEPVASVGIYPTRVRTPRGEIAVGGIGAVATHPNHRRLGLSTLCLEDAHATMRAAGLHVGLLGTGIPDFYRKLGWENAGRQWRFSLDRGNVSFLPDANRLEVTDEWRPHAAALCALHNAEPLGAPRTDATFVLRAERKFVRLVVATRAGQPVAYAGLRDSTAAETAGAPDNVAALLRAIFMSLDDPQRRTTDRIPGQTTRTELGVITPVRPDGLPALLTHRGVPHTLSYQGMLKILDAPTLFAALNLSQVDLERIQLPSGRDGWRLHANRTLDLSEPALVKLCFGPERFPNFAPELFPLPFFQCPADRV